MTNDGKRPLKVGFGLPDSADGATGVTASWREIADVALRAEAVGFDSVWVQDHLLFRLPEREQEGVWESFSMLSALAAVTSRVEVGTLVTCTSFRNPALTAKMADTIDEISGGRVILGLGAGWHEPEYRAFGYPFDHRVSRFEEALQIIHGLLHNGEIDFNGTYYQAHDCAILPRGPRRDGLPIMMGTTGERMLDLTARYADIWNVYFTRTNNSPEGMRPLMERVDAACEAVGRDPATLARSATIYVDFTGAAGGASSVNPSGATPLSGEPEQIADVLRRYADLGVSHVQVYTEPLNLEGVEHFAPVLEALDRG